MRAQKVVIYGSEGIGKSTLASCFPNPLFIDTEGGTAQLDVRRIEKPGSFDGLVSIVNEVAADPSICKTLILDTADWAEQMCIVGVCAKYKKSGIEDFGYGKGYTYLAEEYSRLLNAFDAVIAAGIHVVITAHAKMRKFEQPDEMGAYDRWEMKLSKQVAPLLKEWCDLLLFCNYKTIVVATKNDTKKAQGGKRVIHTTHHPCWDAKNRHGLPDEIDLDYGSIAHLFDADAPAASVTDRVTDAAEPTPLERVRKLMMESQVAEQELQAVVAQKGHFSGMVPVDQYPEAFLTGWVIPHWKKIVETIEADPDRLPF
ncbi:MAG: ATP-binding protein [Oscillospiraceae bacterium]|nr:ATP-binding protein [Oscillospiraceae bacterium]